MALLVQSEAWKTECAPDAPLGLDFVALCGKSAPSRTRLAAPSRVLKGTVPNPFVKDPGEHFLEALELDHPWNHRPLLERDPWFAASAAAALSRPAL